MDSTKPQDRDEQWARILQLTTKMRLAADSEEWETIAEMESHRSSLIHEFFSVPANKEEAPALERGILEILAIDTEIIDLGRNCREKIGHKLNKINASHQATNAYIQNSR